MNTIEAPAGIERPLTRDVLEGLVRSFYREVRADRELGPVFEAAIGDHWEPHLARMVDFWSTILLKTRSFRGNVFGKHMAVGDVRPEHFLRWLTLWNEQTALWLAPADAAEALGTAQGIARNLFYGYFGTFALFRFEAGRAVAWYPDPSVP